jgi:hypothetical protein
MFLPVLVPKPKAPAVAAPAVLAVSTWQLTLFLLLVLLQLTLLQLMHRLSLRVLLLPLAGSLIFKARSCAKKFGNVFQPFYPLLLIPLLIQLFPWVYQLLVLNLLEMLFVF